MNPVQTKAVVLDMTFGNTTQYDRFVRDVRRDAAIEENIVRGRVAQDGVWMRLELRGASRGIEGVVERWREFIVACSNEPVLAA